MAFDAVIDKVRLENAMTATANAIREKTGDADLIIWDEDKGFADAVSDLTADEINPPGLIPANLKAAAMEIVQKVKAVKKDDSIVFMAMSDSHHTGEQNDTGWQTLTNLGNLHAGMAAKVLSYALDLDFVCHLGDLTFGHGTTTSAQLHQQIEEMNKWLDEAWVGIPRFQTVGNHDTGYYAYTNSGVPLESNEYLFSVFGKYCEGAIYGSETYGYCYRDFESKKLRVICLNTSEGDSLNASYECSPAQLLWFAQTMQDVGAKSGWSVIVLGHYPLDYYGMQDATAVVKAYVEGSSITVNGTAVDFSGSNQAKFIANFHGHTHCFKVARLNQLNTSTMTATEYDAWRVGIPNSGFYRSNHQEGPNAYGLYFEEETTYDKVNDGVNDTAFVVNVITPSEEVIHSFCYGAGYDRAIGYGETVWHKVTATTSNCTVSMSASSVPESGQFTATINPNEHCDIASVTVTMGGVDITSSVYSDGVVTIPSVTGDIVINARAVIALACTNQIPISTDSSGEVYNASGYKKGCYVNSAGNDTSHSSIYSTGFIPCKGGMNSTIYMKDVGFNRYSGTSSYERITVYDSNKQYITQWNSASYAVPVNVVMDDDGTWTSFQIRATTNSKDTSGDLFIRISASYLGEDSIVTVDEEIKYADEVDAWVVTNNLTFVNSSNSAATVDKGAAYTTTLTTRDGYVIESVTVTMMGVDITSTAYSNGVVTITSVTGNVVITATAVAVSVSYTNQLPISTDASGNVYNGKGFKENTYLSSGGEGSSTGIYASGFIPCPKSASGYSTMFYFKNVGMQTGQDKHRLGLYNADKSYNAIWKTSNTAANFVYGDDGNVISFSIPATKVPDGGGFIRVCGSYLGADSIITVNEEIT